MKREEAMQILQVYKDEIGQRIDRANAPEAKDVYQLQMDVFDMAIKALNESRQRETNKEIAERIIDITCKNRVFCELYPDECRKEDCDIYLVINTFSNTPDTDTPSQQRGEWVRKYDGHINCYWYECDQCGEYRPRNQFGHEYNANFCPNCGADMREPKLQYGDTDTLQGGLMSAT